VTSTQFLRSLRWNDLACGLCLLWACVLVFERSTSVPLPALLGFLFTLIALDRKETGGRKAADVVWFLFYLAFAGIAFLALSAALSH
jgi:hypothetical protein